MTNLTPEEYNHTYTDIGELKLLIRITLDAEKCETPWDVTEAYHKLQATIYRRWQLLKYYLERDSSLMAQFFGVFEVLAYAHERSRRIHRAKVLETRLPKDITVGELVEGVQRLTYAVQDLPGDARPNDLEPLLQDFHNAKGLKELAAVAEKAVEAYLDAKVAADYRDFQATKEGR